MMKIVVKSIKRLLLLALVAAAGWGVWWGVKWWRELNGPIEGAMSPYAAGTPIFLERTTPAGERFTVDTDPAAYRLEVLPEDGHARQVFASYGAALRYARGHKLPTLPSVSLILSSCASADYRLQAALETALDSDPKIGRDALLQRWLVAAVAFREHAPPAARPASEAAVGYLTAALQDPSDIAKDPPLGPWASTPKLRAIWRRDRLLGRGIKVSDDLSAATAAILARTMTADPELAAGWRAQAAVSRVLYGQEPAVSFEALAERLAGVPDAALAGAEAVASVRAFAGTNRLAPAAMTMVKTPEEEVLLPLQMAAWNDPMGALMAAIRSGEINLAPDPDAGFYRYRWFALETLAAPGKAPETRKLQLSADYQRRWERAFAAGFTEGRSGLIKRFPILTMGGRDPGTIRVDLAPEFTAEPAPVVYLRLARAYRMLDQGLSAALGEETWLQLRDAADQPLAAGLRQWCDTLHGLALIVYREVGQPPEILASETALDRSAAETAARAWCATLETDPDVNRDARLLVTLANDNAGSYRCPAVLGVRLEPVEYSWVEGPIVPGFVEATLVPARYWLASPLTATVTVTAIPSPEEFRKRCDGATGVRELYRAFGESPPRLHAADHRWWRWVAAVAVMAALIAGGWAILRWWWRRPKRARWRMVAKAAVVCLGLGALAVFYPPQWLLRLVLVRGLFALPVYYHDGGEWFTKWAGNRIPQLFLSFLRSDDPQLRYYARMFPVYDPPFQPAADPFTPDELAFLRSKIHDEVPEAGYAAWFVLCNWDDELPFLLRELDRHADGETIGLRLGPLVEKHPKDPAVIAAAVRLAGSPDPSTRAAMIRQLGGWWAGRSPAFTEIIRAATADPEPVVRVAAASALGSASDASHLDRLLPLLEDADRNVRFFALLAVTRHTERRSGYSGSAEPVPRWTDEPIQRAVLRYAENSAVSFDERLNVARRIADPAALRASCRTLLPITEQLPETPAPNGLSRKPRSVALALLAVRWVLADHYAEISLKNSSEHRFYLDRDPDLLARLTQCIAENRSDDATVARLREVANQPGNNYSAKTLLSCHGD